MVAILNKDSLIYQELVDPSVFYFEASLNRQQADYSTGEKQTITTIQTYPMVPCTKELFAVTNLAWYFTQKKLESYFCVDFP